MNPEKRTQWIRTGALLGLFVLVMNWQSLADRVRGAVEYDRAAAGPVTVFSTAWCGYCKKTTRFLQAHDIPFEERDIETSAAARDAFVRLGGSGVPLVKVGDTIVHGYSLPRLRAALECAACQPGASGTGDTMER